jgi:hypothetical protein
MKKHRLPTKKADSLRSRNAGQTILSSVTANFKSPKDFPLFSKLPQEIRLIIWEMTTEEGRIVAVRSVTRGGLRSPVPPILHVCSESRAVGLKQYALCFSALPESFWEEVAPARVYFNFDRDTLYFRKDWNYGVDGACCCIFYLSKLIEDLRKVKAVGFDLNAKICSSRSSSNHKPNFALWTGLTALYLGLEEPRLNPESQIGFRELQSKDYSAFMREYRRSPCWVRVPGRLEDAAAVEYIKNGEIRCYCPHGPIPEPEGFCAKLCPVHVVGL